MIDTLLKDEIADDVYIELEDGLVSPVRWGFVKIARTKSWYPASKYDSRRFNQLFYGCIKAGRKVGQREVRRMLAILRKHFDVFRLDKDQAKGAVGLELGIFTKSGKFKASARESLQLDIDAINNGKDILLRNADVPYERNPGSLFTPEEWGSVMADALRVREGMPMQASIDEEFSWIRANNMCWADFDSAPSSGAIKDWMVINKPGNDGLLNDFTKLCWNKRMTAVSSGRQGKAVMDSDARASDVQISEDRREREMFNQMFGDD